MSQASAPRRLCGSRLQDDRGADLAAWAGTPCAQGNQHVFLQLTTMMFRWGNVETERAMAEVVPRLPERMLEAQARGDYAFPRFHPILRPQADPASGGPR